MQREESPASKYYMLHPLRFVIENQYKHYSYELQIIYLVQPSTHWFFGTPIFLCEQIIIHLVYHASDSDKENEACEDSQELDSSRRLTYEFELTSVSLSSWTTLDKTALFTLKLQYCPVH